MYNINDFWEKIFEKLRIIEHLINNEFFMLSRSDCSMVFNNELKIRLEDYFIFRSREELPDIFKLNGLVIIQKYKSTFSICYADNYFRLPILNYESITYEKPIHTLNIRAIETNSISLALSLLKIGLFEDLLASFDGSSLYATEIYNYNSILSETKKFDVVYKSNHTYRTQLLKIGFVKLFYDLILEDSKNLYVLTISNKLRDTVNRSLLYNIQCEFKQMTRKNIVFIELYKEKEDITLFELIFKDETDIYSLDSINEMRFKVKMQQYTEQPTKFILTDPKSKYFESHESVPFPQANDFEKVIKYCDLIYNNQKSLQEMVTGLGVTSRQVEYYKNSCLFLELVRIQDKEVFLSPELSEIYRDGTIKDKIDYFISSIMENELLFNCYNLFVDEELTVAKLSTLLEGKYTIGEGTVKRRISTIKSWFKWLERVIKMNNENVDFEVVDIGLIERVKSIVRNMNTKRIQMYVLKNKLRDSLEYDLDERELLRKIKKSDLFFSEELQIVFETREDYYKYLK